MNILRRPLILAAAMTLLFVAPPPAQAAGLRCKSDPTVLLSDGTILDLSADIGASVWDVSSVQYTIHIPAGLRVIAVFSTPNWPTTTERFAVYADQASKHYASSTVVRTSYATDVTAQLVVNTHITCKSGTSGQSLPTAVADSSLLSF